MPALARALTVSVLPLSVLLMSGCSSSGDAGNQASTAVGVTMTDDACTLERTSAPAGTIEFALTNKGTKVNEFYVYGAQDRVLGEAENIAPGTSRTFRLDVAEPGSYVTACKPGMSGSGIRGDFTVTAQAPSATPS
jgi:iron uptake system component EfeO